MKCPICGCENTLYVSFLYQYSLNYKLNKKGHINCKATKRDEGFMDCVLLCCKNGCDLNEKENWHIDENDNVIIKE